MIGKIASLGIGSIIETVGKVASDLVTTDKERLEIALKEKEIEAGVMQAQMAVNQEESKHASLFVAGWRPFIGWVGGVSLAYQFILYPLLLWAGSWLQAQQLVPAGMAPPPVLEADVLWVLISGMLGIAGMRTFDKWKGVSTVQVGKK